MTQVSGSFLLTMQELPQHPSPTVSDAEEQTNVGSMSQPRGAAPVTLLHTEQ